MILCYLDSMENILSESRNPLKIAVRNVFHCFFLIAAIQDNLYLRYIYEVGQLLTAVKHFYLIQCQEYYLTTARI